MARLTRRRASSVTQPAHVSVSEDASPLTQEGSHQLPPGWTWKTVEELVVDTQYGSSAKTLASETGVPVLRMGNIRNGELVLDSLKYLPANHPEFPTLHLRDGDILFNRTNSAELVGKCAVYRSHPAPCSFASYLIRLRPRPGLVPEFLAWYINSPFGRAWIASVVSQQVGQANVNGTKLKNLRVPVPAHPEQERIVAEIEKQFTRLDAGAASLTRTQTQLKRYRSAILKAACEGRLLGDLKSELNEPVDQLFARILEGRRLFPKGRGRYKEPKSPDDSDRPPIPPHWMWATVEQISTKVVDGVHKKPTYVSSGIPFVTVKNLTAGSGISFAKLNYISPADHTEFIKRADPERGDVLVSKDGTLGVVRKVNTDIPFSIFVSVAMIKPVLREMSDYLRIALESPQVQAQMVPKGSGLQHIHLEDLREDCIPLPPLAEQNLIVAEVERRLSVVDELERLVDANLKRAKNLRQSILHRAFSGQL